MPPPPAAPASTKEQLGAALQTAGQYAGGSTVWTPQNAEELGLDPERGYIAKGTPTDQPQPTVEQLRQDLQQSGALPKPVTPTIHPGLHGFTNGEQAAPPQQSQRPGPVASPLPEPPVSVPTSGESTDLKGAISEEEHAKGKAATSQLEGAVSEEEHAKEGKAPRQLEGAVSEEEHAKEAAAPSTTQKPVETAPDTTTPVQAAAPPAAQVPTAPDQNVLYRSLLDQGHSPGAAQAIVAGQQPKTLTGETPPPPEKSTQPQPETMSPQETDLAAQFRAGTNNTPEAKAANDKDIRIASGQAAPSTEAKSAATSTVPTEPGTTTGGKTINGTSTIFALNYDGSLDQQDNGQGFFTDPKGHPIDTRKAVGAAVPWDILENIFGVFTKSDGKGGRMALDTPEAKAIIAKIQSAHIEVPDDKGHIHKFPIVDIQGSIAGHPGKVLDLTLGATKELGYTDNHHVSYQIVGGDGKPYPVPDISTLPAYAGEGKGGGPAAGPGGPAGPWISVGGAPSGGAAAPEQFRGPSEGGGGGAQPDYSPSESGAAPVSLAGLGGLLAGAAAGALRGGQQAAQPSEEKGPSPSDVVSKVLAAGGPPPAPGAAPVDLSTMKQANVLAVRTPQLGLPAPPAAPSAAPAPPDPIVIKGLMKRGFTREQALAFAAKATVSKPGAAALAGGASFRAPAQLPAPPPAPARQPPAVAKPQPVPPQPPAPSGKAPPAKPAPPQEQPPARFEAASHNMRPLGYRAAVRLPNGEVFSGPEHADALDKAVENASMRVSDATTHYGFVDKKQNFIGMDEADRLLEKHWYKQRNLPQEASSIGPKGSTVGVPNPPGGPSPDDPRVKKQKDNLTKGEHFVAGDDFHDQLLAGLPGGHGGRQRQILGQAEEAIAEKRPMHISYISAPQEAEKFPTRESRTIQYDAHSPEARLMGTTEGQLVGHSFIPVSVGVSPSRKAGEPHQGYIQGLSTNVLANNFAHLNTKLAAMGKKTPYARFGTKFANDLEGYLHNLNAGHTGTGRGYALGTAEYPNEPDTSHVPYKLSRHEADFLNAVINNTGAFAKHEDGQALRELARVNGTLITPAGETNRLLHEIEQHDPGWSGRGSGQRGRVLEPSIRSFKTGLVHEVHPSEEHLPATIRPGQEYRDLTAAMQRTSERGRPDVPVAVSLHHTFADNKAINQIEREFSEERISEADARARLHALGEDPEQYRFVGGSGGLITPYEENPEAITPEEHSQLKDNLRKQWIGGKMPIEDYRRKAAEVPLPEIPSRQKETPSEEPTSSILPKPEAPKPAKPAAPPEPKPEETEPAEEPAAEPPTPTKQRGFKAYKQPPAPGEPLPSAKHDFKEVNPEEFIAQRNKSTRAGFLSELKPEDIKSHKLFTNHEGTVGAAVSPEGDIQNVFNNGGPKGAAAHAIGHAIEQHGGKTLDAYDGFLPDYYRQFGFHETGRMKFNPAFAHNWDTAKQGTPDVVFMAHKGYPEGGHAAAVERTASKDKTKWIPNEQSSRYDDDWDAQKARSRSEAVAGGEKDYRTAGVEQGPQAQPAGGEAQPGSGKAPRGTLTAPPAPGDVLPAPTAPAKAKAKPKTPTPLEKLTKPKDWENAPEEVRQKYLEEKVRQTLANQIRDKATHPLVVQRNEAGGIKYDPNLSPVYEQHDYGIADSPLLKKKRLSQLQGADEHEDTLDPNQHTHLNQVERKRLSALRSKSAVQTMGDKIFESYNSIKDIPEIAAGKGWYSRMREKLAKALGDDHEIFAQLLGATSAKTPVRTNFINALDAYEQWKEGMKDPTNMNLGFNRHIAKYLEAHGKMMEGPGALTQYMRDQGILKQGDPDHESDADAMAHWIKHHDILPKTKTGSKYSANSNAVLKVLAGTWLKEVGAPKTPNFAGNLTGRTLEATIDVWAARHLQRLGYEGHMKGPWRAQSRAEPAVNNLDFAFSQDAMRHAADKIGINPDDLQAILWFAEKHHYEDRGWTRGQGAEKSSFDDVADKVFGKTGEPMSKPMSSEDLRAHYAKEAKERIQRQGKIETARTYTGKTAHKLAPYMAKHGLTHEEVHGAPGEEEEAA